MKRNEIYKKIFKDRKIRKDLARKSHYWFFHIYFPHYIQYKTAPFQKEMFYITENEEIRNAVIVAFRGSAKSTIMTLSYPIWAMLGTLKKQFIILLSQTQQQSRLILSNIKQELETNEVLISDFGPFGQDDDEWRANSLVISQYGTRITTLSAGESIRGLRHLEHRPDLIICDDVEDLASVKTREGRKKTYDWLTGDVIPAGDKNTKLIIIGNMLHEDSLIMRLKKAINKNQLEGVFKAYPLFDTESEIILWPDKFPDKESTERLRKKVANESAWQREYLLRIISDEDRVVHPEWIHFYDTLPDEKNMRYVATGVDLAISEKQTADYTAMVSAQVFGYQEDLRIFILPNPVNKRMTFPETFEAVKRLSKTLGDGHPTKIFIEDVGYQASLIQQLEEAGFPAEAVKIKGQDKKARLSLTTHLIQSGKILFPRNGAELLIEQLTGFGVEKHDDLVDAFSILILKILENSTPEPKVYFIDLDSNLGSYRPLSMDREF